jgi:alkylation response protein AidB-like acyl-CoA dehydrogenase
LATYQAAWLLDEGRRAVRQVSEAKLLAGEAALQAVDAAVRTFGGYGYMAEIPIERLYRDARYFPIVEGTAEIHQRILAKEIGL